METIRDLQKLPALPQGSAVTIGNFDGIHLAHQQLLRRVVECGRTQGVITAAVTFDPHPIRVLAPQRAPKILTSLRQKARLIEQAGIDLLVILPFTQELARLSPAEFVRQVLAERLRAVSVCVGRNFRFGYRQAGDVEMLSALSGVERFKLEVLPIVKVRSHTVSSTSVRQLLAAGKVHMAGRLLGRPFSNCGAIVAGAGVGQRQTLPTLNLEPLEEQLPQTGVYVTRTCLGKTVHDSVTNVGYKPTFGEHRLGVETHLLRFQGEVQEDEMEVEYLHRLRDEIKFQNAAMLKLQIQEDARRSLKFFRLIKHLLQTESPAETLR